MKRLVSLLLAAMMVLSLVACSNQKAEKYCSHCGNGMTKDASFCAECGTAVNGKTEESKTTSTTTKTKKSSTTTKKATQKKLTTTTTKAKQILTAKSTTTAHKHMYTTTVIPATCTDKGYTLYACSCGYAHKDHYIAPLAHEYRQYVCTHCDTVDKAHIYEYLAWWLKENGKVTSLQYSYKEEIGNYQYTLSYSTYLEEVLCLSAKSSLTHYEIRLENGGMYFGDIQSNLYLSDFSLNESKYYANQSYSVFSTPSYWKIEGQLNGSQYVSSSLLPYEKYTGADNFKDWWIEESQRCINHSLSWLKTFLYENNIGITIADLGFTAYQ